jgi:hypothetical protein
MKTYLQQREALLREQLAITNQRLSEITEIISEQGLTVDGSRPGTIRPHPLFKAESDLRRERTKALDELEETLRRLEAEKLVAEANALWKNKSRVAD